MAVTFLIMSVSCNRAGVPAATLLPAKQDNWQHYNGDIKTVVDKYGAKNAQFAVETGIIISKTRDTSFLNKRGDVVDSTISETITIDAITECLFSSEDTKDGWIMYKMEFKMKKNEQLIYLYFSAKKDELLEDFTIKCDPDNPGKIYVAFKKTEIPTLWSVNTDGQVLMYSAKSGTRPNNDVAKDNRLPGR